MKRRQFAQWQWQWLVLAGSLVAGTACDPGDASSAAPDEAGERRLLQASSTVADTYDWPFYCGLR